MFNCQKVFFHHANVTTDESFFPCRSRCPLIQYTLEKPEKFGIKFWIFCDSETYYVLRTFQSTGETDRVKESLGNYVAIKLMSPYFNMGITVTTDNFL